MPELDKSDPRSWNRLIRNRDDGTFVDATEKACVAGTGYDMGVVMGDYDNDGDTDLLVVGLRRNTLYRNDGAGRLSDFTEKAGSLSPTPSSARFGPWPPRSRTTTGTAASTSSSRTIASGIRRRRSRARAPRATGTVIPTRTQGSRTRSTATTATARSATGTRYFLCRGPRATVRGERRGSRAEPVAEAPRRLGRPTCAPPVGEEEGPKASLRRGADHMPTRPPAPPDGDAARSVRRGGRGIFSGGLPDGGSSQRRRAAGGDPRERPHPKMGSPATSGRPNASAPTPGPRNPSRAGQRAVLGVRADGQAARVRSGCPPGRP